MVVQGIIALALALPTGMLFGVGYGTGVRIGYEQVYPLLFPKDSENRNVTPTVENIKNMNKIYDTIGGKEASQMGIAVGLSGAMSELNNNPDFQDLVELESKLSGRIPSNLNPHNQSEQTSNSDSESDLSLSDFKDKQGNFSTANDPDLYIFILKQQGNNAQTETNFAERKVKLRTLISKLTPSQIKDAYSDMLSNRLQPPWAQQDSQFKQILTLEFKKLTGNPVKPPAGIIESTGTNTAGTAVAIYQNEKTRILKLVLQAKRDIADLQNHPNVAFRDANMPPREKQLAKVRKQLQNLITINRGITSVKPFANSDWNARIWT